MTSRPRQAASSLASRATSSSASSCAHRVVVEQGHALGAGLVRDPDGVLHRAVTPRALAGELAGRVLRIMDHEIGTVAQLQSVRVDAVGAVRWLLMVGEVGDGHPVPRHPVAEGGSDVGNGAGHDLRPADREVVVADVVERDRAAEPLERDREVRRADEEVEGVVHAAAVLLNGRVDVQSGAVAQQRDEERQALDVVPVEVGQERGAQKGLVRLAAGPEVPESRAEVEHDRSLIPAVHGHARGVAAVAHGPFAGAWRGAADSVELDVDHSVDPL